MTTAFAYLQKQDIHLTVDTYSSEMESGAFIYEAEKISALLEELQTSSMQMWNVFPVENVCPVCSEAQYFQLKFNTQSALKEITGCTHCSSWCLSDIY